MEEKIIKNFEIFQKLLTKVGDRSDVIASFLEKYGERIAVCPSHGVNKRSTAAPGGLVEHSLNTFKIARKLVEAAGVDIEPGSLALVCLLHEVGKIGDDELDYFIPQNSDWHRERGNVYTYNPELPKMTHAHRTLYILQRAGVNLSLHEWIAILTQHGTASEENRFYQGCENNLAVILQSAVRIAVMKEEDI